MLHCMIQHNFSGISLQTEMWVSFSCDLWWEEENITVWNWAFVNGHQSLIWLIKNRICEDNETQSYSRCHTERRLKAWSVSWSTSWGLGPAKPSVDTLMTKICFSVTWLNCNVVSQVGWISTLFTTSCSSVIEEKLSWSYVTTEVLYGVLGNRENGFERLGGREHGVRKIREYESRKTIVFLFPCSLFPSLFRPYSMLSKLFFSRLLKDTSYAIAKKQQNL